MGPTSIVVPICEQTPQSKHGVQVSLQPWTLIEPVASAPETEKKIEEARFLGVYEHSYPTNRLERAGFGTHYVVLAYELTSPEPELRLPSDQHGEFAWLTEEELLRCVKVHQNVKSYFTSTRAGG